MRLLDRYLLRELLLPLGFCLGGILTFWVAFDLFAQLAEFQKAKMHGPDIAEYYLASTPEILVIVLPVALLLALLYALTHHARHNEITAIRAAGVSLWRLAAPYLGVGLTFSLILFALNELVVPRTTVLADDLLTRRIRPAGQSGEAELVRNLGFYNARERHRWQIGTYNLKSGEMTHLNVTWPLPDGTWAVLYAEQGRYTNGCWAFSNVSELRQTSPTDATLIPFLKTNYLAVAELKEPPEQIRSEVKISNGLSIRRAKRADIPLVDLLDYLRLHPTLLPADRAWLYTKLHGRIAAPWTCAVVVLIALPFGAASGRRNIFAGVASSIFICFAYFVLQQLALAFGSGGFLPPWLAAWLPNLVFGGAALFLISRVR